MDNRVFVAILVAMFLFGCKGGQQETGIGTSRAFVGGSEGIDIQFFDDAPPSEVYDTPDSAFDISVRLENKGETDVEEQQSKVTISGVDAKDFGKTSQDELSQPVEFTLLGARLDPRGTTIPGTIANVDFTDLVYTGEITGTVMFNLKGSVCYKYSGKAIAKLCVLEKLMAAPKDSDICKVTRSDTPDNSGSPIHVIEFAQSATGSQKLSIRFKLKHVGVGKFFDPGTAAECDETDRSKWDKVKVKVSVGTGMTVKCPSLGGADAATVEGTVKLFGGEKDITCKVTVTDLNNYEKPINIETEYNYLKSTTKSLLVRHIEEEDN